MHTGLTDLPKFSSWMLKVSDCRRRDAKPTGDDSGYHVVHRGYQVPLTLRVDSEKWNFDKDGPPNPKKPSNPQTDRGNP